MHHDPVPVGLMEALNEKPGISIRREQKLVIVINLKMRELMSTVTIATHIAIKITFIAKVSHDNT